MNTVIFWFRNDLRLHDQPALAAALASGATHLLPVVCLPAPDERTPWGFARVGAHRRAFTAAALRGLQGQTSALGNPLLICQAPPATALPQLARAVGATTVVCEDIAAPYEQAEVAALRRGASLLPAGVKRCDPLRAGRGSRTARRRLAGAHRVAQQPAAPGAHAMARGPVARRVHHLPPKGGPRRHHPRSAIACIRPVAAAT